MKLQLNGLSKAFSLLAINVLQHLFILTLCGIVCALWFVYLFIYMHRALKFQNRWQTV